ncbi:MAG: VCBS repeat-containing protein, partial [Thermoplasmata archaeon]
MTVLVVMALLMTSSTVTEDVMAASGIVTTFSNGEDEGLINYTKEDDNADYSIRLPKQSNVLEADMQFEGTDYLKQNVNKTIKTSWDWRQGTQTPESTLISETTGFHLDMDTLAPFEAEKTINAGSDVFSIASGDFNKDGRADLVVVNYDADTATVFLQNAQGKMIKDRDVNTDDTPRTVEVGDLNHDGRDDFAVGTYNGKSVNIFKSKATGGFDKSTISLTRQVLDLDIADLNNDGRDDIVLATYASYGEIYFQTGTGSFSLHRSMTVTSGGYYWYTYYVRGCAAGDFNNDGRVDVAFTVSTTYTSTWAYQYYGMMKVHLQSSSGTFSSSHTWRYYAYNYAYGIDAGDVTGDGRDDIVITNHYINQIRVWTQRGTGGFSGTGTT